MSTGQSSLSLEGRVSLTSCRSPFLVESHIPEAILVSSCLLKAKSAMVENARNASYSVVRFFYRYCLPSSRDLSSYIRSRDSRKSLHC